MLLAADFQGLAAEGRRVKGLIELVPHVGAFIAVGEPLFHLHGGAAGLSPDSLRRALAFGRERTMEQDPMFAFRILVDIAVKALSSAINDPTTAVLALDQIHRLLRILGRRQLRSDAIRDARAVVRVVFRTPDWEDFVHMACNEIRSCGASSSQVARRMMAMLTDLLRLLPPDRHAPLRAQLDLLERALAAAHPFPEDLAFARIPDLQGIGGTPRRSAAVRAREA